MYIQLNINIEPNYQENEKNSRLTDISSSKYFGMLYSTAIPTDVGMRNFFQLKWRRGNMMAWNRSNVTAKVMYTEPIRNVWIKPNIIRIIHSPPRNTLDVYQVDITGRPNERMAASRNKASNAAKPLNRLEKDAPLLSPPLQIGLEVLNIFV